MRAVSPIAPGGPPIRVHHDFKTEAWLQVAPGGTWEGSIEVTETARDVFDLYLPLRTAGTFVIGQAGQSLDGRIATATGQSHYITGPDDIRRLHRLRALADAVVVGAGTVVADNPHLTVRAVDGEHPVRVVLNPGGRVPRACHLFSDGQAPTLEVRREEPSATASDATVIRLPAIEHEGHAVFPPERVLAALGGRGLRRVLVEGGGVTVSRFLEAGALDRLHLTVAPLLIGSGPSALRLPPIDSLTNALRPACRTFRLGRDVLFDLDFRAPVSPPSGTPTRARRGRTPQARW